MNKFLLILLSFLLLGLTAVQAGVIRETKSSVSFKGLGKYETIDKDQIVGLMKRTDTESEFEGEGIMGGMGAMFLGEENSGQLIVLGENKIYHMDHEEEEYYIVDIKKIDFDRENMEADHSDKHDEESHEEKESSIKIVRREFKVNATGNEKNINDFDCTEYSVLYLTEWEDTESGKRGIDSLISKVWTTKETGAMKQVYEEEMAFTKEYMKAIGLEMDAFQDEILGTNWMSMFSKMGQKQSMKLEDSEVNFVQEMQKIEGYPIVIDGSYFMIRPGEEMEEVEEEEKKVDVTDAGDVGGLFGGLISKAIEKEVEPEVDQNAPAFSWYTEVVKLELDDISPANLSVPDDYDLVEK